MFRIPSIQKMNAIEADIKREAQKREQRFGILESSQKDSRNLIYTYESTPTTDNEKRSWSRHY